MDKYTVYKAVSVVQRGVYCSSDVQCAGKLYYRLGHTTATAGTPIFCTVDANIALEYAGEDLLVLMGYSTQEPFPIHTKMLFLPHPYDLRGYSDIKDFWEGRFKPKNAWKVEKEYYGVYDFTPLEMVISK